MIDKLYSKYFQKSRSFLYPVLGIKKKSSVIPTGTYVSIKDKIGPEDMKLICTFKNDTSEEFKTFENQMLLSNPLFSKKISTKDTNIYVFDLEIYKTDYFNFILGKYSLFSKQLKRAIKNYYGEQSAEYEIVDSYLNPEKYFENYAKLLGIDVNVLKEVGELCNPCDIDKETLKISVKELQSVVKM